jgi:5'-3' exonuclease
MGIPSYYKRLLDSVSGFSRKSHPGSIDWLWMDFNCMIYHCLRRPSMPTYPGNTASRDAIREWEQAFLAQIQTYLAKIVHEVRPTRGVYIAVDGVVPMAKMRQQRLRRFKSAWMAGKAETDQWDTNAITPGTQFMTSLRKSLEAFCTRRSTDSVRYILSSSDEPGEGEHKIMQQWRTGEYDGTYAVYGLDADLIVLSLLNAGEHPCWLFREEMEVAGGDREPGDEQYCWLSMNILRDYIQSQIGPCRIEDYAFAMSVLGNDFLPSSLSFKMRDDGHTSLLECLQQMSSRLIRDDGSISWEGVEGLLSWLAKNEEWRLRRFVNKKLSFATSVGAGLSDCKVGDDNWPLVCKEEEILLGDDWREQYCNAWLGGREKGQLCTEYLYGMQWIWAYYTGKMDTICFNWCYPVGMPPLWSDILRQLRGGAPAFPGTAMLRAEDIRPTEQLCLVLPPDSWHLLDGAPRERQLLVRAPWLFPRKFGFSTVGKRFFWECEAEIPVPTIAQVKVLLT